MSQSKQVEPVKHTPRTTSYTAKSGDPESVKPVDHGENDQPTEQPAPSHAPQEQEHAPYPVKPEVQHVNEKLTTATSTGYAAHDQSVDLDKAQLASQKRNDTDSYKVAKQRVEEDEKQPSSAKGAK